MQSVRARTSDITRIRIDSISIISALRAPMARDMMMTRESSTSHQITSPLNLFTSELKNGSRTCRHPLFWSWMTPAHTRSAIFQKLCQGIGALRAVKDAPRSFGG